MAIPLESNLDLVGALPRASRTVSQQQREELRKDMSGEVVDVKGVMENFSHLLPLVTVGDGENVSTSKRVRYLNNLAKVIKHIGHVVDPYYPVEKVIESARLALASHVKEVRAGALRVLRYLLCSKEVFAIMLRYRVDILVARSLDAPPLREIERLQAMRFVRQALSVSPLTFPRTLVAPMVSILLNDADPPDNLTWACMATLAELALLNPELAARMGAVKALLRGLLKCQTLRISESVILTLASLLNNPSSRKYIQSQLDMESLLAPITDLHYRYLVEDVDRSLTRNDHEFRVEASKMALVAMLRSWPGVFCLCSPNNSGLSSLISMLPLAKPLVQREILDVLFNVFQLKVPEWTDDYWTAVTSIDPSEPKNEWSLTEGWVAEEGKDLLPPKMGGRTNLIDCYQAMLLVALMEAGLFESLVEVVKSADRHVTVMATILMGELLHLTSTILPPEFSSDSNCLPDLIASAMAFDTHADRNCASEVISCLDRVHQLKKHGVKPSSLYLKLILEQSGYFLRRPSVDKELFHCIPADMDEATLNGLVKETNVLATKDYLKWKWGLIFSLLQHPCLRNPQLLEDALFSKFIKRLCNFYKPSNRLYSVITYSEVNSRRYSFVGQQLVKYLCQVEEGSAHFLVNLLSDIAMELGQVTASKLTADVFSVSSVGHKLARDYFLFLGTVSFHKVSILMQCKVYGPLLDICNYHNRGDLMKLSISSLDFGHDTHSRVILSKLLTSTERGMRLYATRHMRVLLRAKMPFFNSWGLELLIAQLYDLDKQVALEALDILDEACEEENFLEALVLQQPALLHLGEKGAALMTRFISVRRGFALMSRLGYLHTMLERWWKNYNTLYVYIVEERLAENLTSYKQTNEGEFIRRSSSSAIHPKAFVPVHFYGQLVQQGEGCELLEKEGHVKKFAEVIRQRPVTQQEILGVKAVVWALGHIGSSPGGLDLLVREDIVGDLVEMAENSPVLSIRGTCYYALCLISKTPHGADVLLDEGWTTVRHSSEEKWPLVFKHGLEIDDTTFASPDPRTPVKTFPPLFGSFDFNTLPTQKSSVRTLPKFNWSDSGTHGAYRGRSHLPKVASYTGMPSQSSVDEPPTHKRMQQAAKKEGAFAGDDTTDAPIPDGSGLKHQTLERTLRRNRKFVFSLKEPHRSPSFLRLKPCSVLTRMRSDEMPHKRSESVSFVDVRAEQPKAILSMRSLSRSLSGGKRLRTSVVGGASFFIGVCLPLEIQCMFEYKEDKYEGFRTEVISAPDFDQENYLPHDPAQCLECYITFKSSENSLGSDSLQPLAHATSSGSLSPGVRSRSHTNDSRIEPNASPKTSKKAEEGDVTVNIEKSPQVSKKMRVGGAEERREGEPSGLEVETGGRRGREKARGKERSPGEEGRRSRSHSPLVRMRRIDSGTNGSEEHAAKEREEGGGDDVEIRAGGVEESKEGQLSEEGSSQGGSSKEEVSSSQSSGTKGVFVTVVGSSTSEGGPKSVQSHEEGGDTVSVSSTTTTQSAVIEETSQEGRRRLHHAVLELVYNLSSDISMRKNIMGLTMICQRFPSVEQDVCLYSKVMDLLSMFQYTLSTRRLVQAKFDRMTFGPLFAAKPQIEEDVLDEDLISSGQSSRRDSISSAEIVQPPGDFEHKIRRRSSTGDVSRFKERMKKFQLHENHEDIVDNRNANNSMELITLKPASEEKLASAPYSKEPPSGNKLGDNLPKGNGGNHIGTQSTTSRSVDDSVLSIVNVTYEL